MKYAVVARKVLTYIAPTDVVLRVEFSRAGSGARTPPALANHAPAAATTTAATTAASAAAENSLSLVVRYISHLLW
jgi:hypothetical protein